MRRFALARPLAACGVPAPEPAPAPEPGPVLPDEFPHGMKGLSMYGYVQDGRTYFTLITGSGEREQVRVQVHRTATRLRYDLVDDSGKTPLALAQEKGKTQAADYLSDLPT